jgi:Bifunctional DNA primase/polymerase, N-terminal
VTHDRLMRSALSAAARGMYVFPLRPQTKVPAVPRDWEGCATTDVDRIERWWNRAPYNVGVATGPSRLLVVDLDVPKPSQVQTLDGRAVFAELAHRAGSVVPIDTLTVVTASGGQHLFFRAPAGSSLTNTASRLGTNIDTRACGGYVVGAGSVVGGRLYRVIRRAEPAAAPAWIVDALRPAQPSSLVLPSSVAASNYRAAYVRAAVDSEARRVADAPVGQRNQVLFRAAASLSRFVPVGLLSAEEVRAALTVAAARHLGVEHFSHEEVRRTIESGIHRGVRQQKVDAAPSSFGHRSGLSVPRIDG